MNNPVPAPLLFAVTANGTSHSARAIPDIRTKVQTVEESSVFDYIDPRRL